MEYRQSILTRRYVGEVFKYALSQQVDIYRFILEFLKSSLKRKIEIGLIDTNNKYFYENHELNKILEKVQKSNNIKYEKMMAYKFYDFSEIIYWIGETIQSWYSELCKDGKSLYEEFTINNLETMIYEFSYLYDEDPVYIYYEVYNLSNDEILELEKLLNTAFNEEEQRKERDIKYYRDLQRLTKKCNRLKKSDHIYTSLSLDAESNIIIKHRSKHFKDNINKMINYDSELITYRTYLDNSLYNIEKNRKIEFTNNLNEIIKKHTDVQIEILSREYKLENIKSKQICINYKDLNINNDNFLKSIFINLEDSDDRDTSIEIESNI